ncbi:MAG: hypothetical protein HQM13_21565 [SAR324 cluster bacterium]|nr:hypothetical protein [SAR324 cluster bacterium]
MPRNIHIISSFICLNCCNQYRVEIGLLDYLAYALEQGTFEEIMDEFPEVLEELEQDEIQSSTFGRFIYEHGQHDVRFLCTRVENMTKIVSLRTEHYKQVVSLYQQYQEVRRAINKTLKQPGIFKLDSGKNLYSRFFLKEDRKKR